MPPSMVCVLPEGNMGGASAAFSISRSTSCARTEMLAVLPAGAAGFPVSARELNWPPRIASSEASCSSAVEISASESVICLRAMPRLAALRASSRHFTLVRLSDRLSGYLSTYCTQFRYILLCVQPARRKARMCHL